MIVMPCISENPRKIVANDEKDDEPKTKQPWKNSNHVFEWKNTPQVAKSDLFSIHPVNLSQISLVVCLLGMLAEIQKISQAGKRAAVL